MEANPIVDAVDGVIVRGTFLRHFATVNRGHYETTKPQISTSRDSDGARHRNGIDSSGNCRLFGDGTGGAPAASNRGSYSHAHGRSTALGPA